MKITSYYIDENNTLHTYCGEVKHITISNVMSDEEANSLIDEENNLIEEED